MINNNEEVIKLLESGWDGIIRIWNFHSGLLINRIRIGDSILSGICLWNNTNLFIGNDNKIKLLDLNKKKIVKSYFGHKSLVVCIKKIYLPKYGECLISQGSSNQPIKLWKIKNKMILI